MSGYTNCACRDCFDVTVSSDVTSPDLCDACRVAGCPSLPEQATYPESGYWACQREDAYGTECANGDGPCPNACQCGCESGTYERQCNDAHSA